ncbi:hypothetical protein HML84_09780 [Alcanivorax sp. IO_7]|nr:hypothetical protein HML84_09780 [Alcanivorax sp. IO_7]
MMHYRVVTLVNQCRRLIRDEFGARLSLTDPDLRESLGPTQNAAPRELKRLMARINEEAGEPEHKPETEAAPDTAARPPRRMYRGSRCRSRKRRRRRGRTTAPPATSR